MISMADELNFVFSFGYLNLSSHMWLIATILDSMALEL